MLIRPVAVNHQTGTVTYDGTVEPIAPQIISAIEGWSPRPPTSLPARDVIGWDNFDRPDTTTTLGRSSCGQIWHDSSSMRVYRGAVQRVSGIGARGTAGHYNPARRHLRASVIVNTPATGDFDCGFILRSPSDASNNLLFVAACYSTSSVKIFKRATGTDTQLATATVSFTLGRRYTFEVQDLDDTIKFFLDGTEILSHTLVAGDISYYASWYDVGLTAHHTRDNFTRFEAFSWRALRPRNLTMPVAIAHRGAICAMAENSLRSLARVPLGAVYGVECDARQTTDGQWVIMHDATVDRTTDGTGTVSAMTSAQIGALTLDGAGGSVPTLSEWLDACQAYGFPEVWIDYASGSISSLTALLSAHAIASKIVVFVSSVAEATLVRAAWPAARIAIGSVTAANVATVVSGATSVGGVETLLISPGDSTFTANVAAVASILAGGFAAGASVTNLSDTLVAAATAGCTVMLNDYAHMIN